jgi:hypothetical protein
MPEYDDTDAEYVTAEASVAQDEAAQTEAPEAIVEQAAAPDPVAAALTEEKPPETPVVESAPASFDGTTYGDPHQPVANPNAYRGVAAGPADHPRTARHHREAD